MPHRLWVAGLVVLGGCTALQRATTETAITSVLVSDEQEAELGKQVQAELQTQGIKLCPDAVVVNYVQSVAARLIPLAQRERNIAWDVQVIDDLKTVNAFAVPGGHIYVYTGLLAAADNEAEVAGVLSHEMGHVVARHSARQMVEMIGLNAVTKIALGEKPSELEQVASTLLTNGVLLEHSRAQETEADGIGVRFASGAGYSPQGLVTFFEKLQAQPGGMPAALTWLSTHPATADRIRAVQELIAQGKLTGSDLGAERLAPVKARLTGTSAPAAPTAPTPGPTPNPKPGLKRPQRP